MYKNALPIKGMWRDTEALNQPEGFATYILNGVNDSFEGSQGTIMNEPGNSICYSLPVNYRAVGSLKMQDEYIIFSTDGTTSEIGLVRDCNYTQLISSTCLNFKNNIKAIYKIVRGCERVIYFVDGENPDKTINIDRLTDYQTNGNWDCSLMEIDRNSTSFDTSTCIESRIITGGQLERGTYEFALAYVDSNDNIIYNTPFTNRKRIFGRLPTTGKGVELTATKLDTRFRKAAFIVYVNGITYKLPSQEFDTSLTNIFTNIPSGATEIPLDEVLIPSVQYETSLGIEEVERRLVRSNVKEKVRDYSNYYSSFITPLVVRYVVEEVDEDEDLEGFMRDEVYALGIMFKYNNGDLSPVFHIPNDYNNCLNSSAGIPVCDEREVTIVTTWSGGPGLFPFNISGLEPNYDYEIDIRDSANGSILLSWAPYTSNASGIISSGVTVGVAGSGNPYILTIRSSQSSLQNCNYYPVSTGFITYTAINPGPFTTVRTMSASLVSINSSTKDATPFDTKYASTGRPGCYNCTNSTYVEPECSNNFYGLSGSISHFQMPDSGQEPLYDYNSNKVRRLGLHVTPSVGATYPDPDIIGHYIMVARRTDSDKTILSKGISGHTHDLSQTEPDLDYVAFSYLRNSAPSTISGEDWHYFFGTDTLYDNKEIEATDLSFRVEGDYQLAVTNPAPASCTFPGVNATGGCDACYVYDGQGGFVWGTEVDTIISTRKLEGQAFVAKNETGLINKTFYASPYYYDDSFNSNFRIINASQMNPVQFFETSGANLNRQPDFVSYNSIKVNRDVYCNLESIIYDIGSDCLENYDSGDESVVFCGGVYVSDIAWSNGMLVQELRASADDLAKVFTIMQASLAIIGVAVLAPETIPSLVSTLGSAGAQLITSALTSLGSLFVSSLIQSRHEMFTEFGLENVLALDRDDGVSDTCVAGITDAQRFLNETLFKVFIESEKNTRWRLSDRENNTCPEHYNGTGPARTYFASKELIYNENNSDKKPQANPVPCPEIYLYDDNLLLEKVQSFAAFSFDFCNPCPGEFPHRLIYSEVSFSEDSDDLWRITKPNNFLDVPATTGEVIALKYYDNILHIHCQDSTYFISPNPREVLTNEETVFIGTGEFLSLIPQEMVQSDVGEGGMQTVMAHAASEAGYLWVDQKNGNVYLRSNGSVQKISQNGLYHWFREEFPSLMNDSWRSKYGEDFPLSGTSHRHGIGVTVVYDPKFNRFIIAKQDYIPIVDYSIRDVSNPTTDLVFDTEANDWRDGTNGSILVNTHDISFLKFEGRCISFSVQNKTWTSFHSYMPAIMYSTDKSFVAHNYNNALQQERGWVFGDRDFQDIFGGEIGSLLSTWFYIEYVDKDFQSFDTHSVQWVGMGYEYDETYGTWVEKPESTFVSLWVYNDFESTGPVVTTTNNIAVSGYYDRYYQYNSFSKLIGFVEGVYRVSDIRNQIQDTSIPTKIKANTPLDYSYNVAAHNYGKSFYDLPNIMNKWVKVRLAASFNDDIKLAVYLVRNKIRSHNI